MWKSLARNGVHVLTANIYRSSQRMRLDLHCVEKRKERNTSVYHLFFTNAAQMMDLQQATTDFDGAKLFFRNKANATNLNFTVVAVNEQPNPSQIVSHVKEVFVHFAQNMTMRFMAGPVLQVRRKAYCIFICSRKLNVQLPWRDIFCKACVSFRRTTLDIDTSTKKNFLILNRHILTS